MLWLWWQEEEKKSGDGPKGKTPAEKSKDKDAALHAWWTENGGMAIGEYDPLEWAKKVNRQSAGTELQSLTYACCVQLSLREAEACAEHKKFMEQFVEDLIYIEESRLMQYEDGHYLVAMRRERFPEADRTASIVFAGSGANQYDDQDAVMWPKVHRIIAGARGAPEGEWYVVEAIQEIRGITELLGLLATQTATVSGQTGFLSELFKWGIDVTSSEVDC